jgi:hypothetical protein
MISQLSLTRATRLIHNKSLQFKSLVRASLFQRYHYTFHADDDRLIIIIIIIILQVGYVHCYCSMPSIQRGADFSKFEVVLRCALQILPESKRSEWNYNVFICLCRYWSLRVFLVKTELTTYNLAGSNAYQ